MIVAHLGKPSECDSGSAGSVLGPLLAISFSFTMKWCALFLLLSMIIAAYLEQVEIHANRCNVNGDPLGASRAIRSAAAKPKADASIRAAQCAPKGPRVPQILRGDC